MTQSDAAVIIQTHVEAFNARDLKNLMAGFTEDASWVTGESVFRGRDELTELFSSAMDGLLPLLEIQNLLTDGDRAACQMVEKISVDGEGRAFAIAGF